MIIYLHLTVRWRSGTVLGCMVIKCDSYETHREYGEGAQVATHLLTFSDFLPQVTLVYNAER